MFFDLFSEGVCELLEVVEVLCFKWVLLLVFEGLEEKVFFLFVVCDEVFLDNRVGLGWSRFVSV